MNPREFYDLAGRLVKINSRAEIRSAISRAYYAAFHVGLEVLGGMDPKWKTLNHDKPYPPPIPRQSRYTSNTFNTSSP